MFIELTLSDGSPLSVDKELIKLWTPTKVLLPNETLSMGALVWVQGIGSYYVIESYDQVSAMMTRKRAVRKPSVQPAVVLTMRKPKPNREG
jgi:hypothetical protein